jgi:hypothetical protein
MAEEHCISDSVAGRQLVIIMLEYKYELSKELTCQKQG